MSARTLLGAALLVVAAAVIAWFGLPLLDSGGTPSPPDAPVVEAPGSPDQPDPAVTAISLDCEFPTDLPAPDAGLLAFDLYAWRLFVAMNWPVTAGQRGVPDCAQRIGTGSDVVWTSYKFTGEIFLPGAVDPGPWNSEAAAPVRLSGISKVSPEVQDAITQPVGSWLTDQRGNPTYYQIAVNQASYDYVRSNEFYNLDVVQAATQVDFPAFATEIKAAWRRLTAEDDAGRYFTRPTSFALYDDNGKPTGQFEDGTAGLVGLHIITKPPGFPQWIWATFEQVDNVTGSDGVPASYNNPDCSGPYCDPPNQSPIHSGQPFTSPNQLTRLTALHPEAVESNARYQAALADTLFQYYHLVTAQYPSDPEDPGNPLGTPTPNVSANVTLESYIQDTSSCMACHSTARVPGGTLTKTDFSFLLLHAQPPAN